MYGDDIITFENERKDIPKGVAKEELIKMADYMNKHLSNLQLRQMVKVLNNMRFIRKS